MSNPSDFVNAVHATCRSPVPWPLSESCNVLNLMIYYVIRGQVVSRVTYAKDATATALLDRSNWKLEEFLPLRNVDVKLFDAGKDPDKDQPIVQMKTRSNGTFDFANVALEIGREYTLVAILRNDDQKLREERVVIEKIKVDKIPDQGAESPISLKQRNRTPAGKDHIVDQTETIQPKIRRPQTGTSSLEFLGGAVIAMNTLMLDVPYLNQNESKDGGKKSVDIDNIGDVSGGILCFPTSMAMVMSYYGKSATTGSIAEEVYRRWSDASFPNRKGKTGRDRYEYDFGTGDYSNIWEWWVWQLRGARNLVGLSLSSPWNYKKDNDDADTLPADGDYAVNWQMETLLTSAKTPYIRRELGRGWPMILGTNLTTAGHIVVLRGVVLKNDGSLHRVILNNPWGKYDSDRADYHTTGVKVTRFMTVRKGLTRDQVADRCVHGKA